MVMWANVAAAAAELGIAAHGRRAEGLVDGRHVSVELSLTDQQTLVLVRGVLDPPLDLGLAMHRRQMALLGSNAVETGSDDLDAEFSIAGDEPPRVRDLFEPALRDHLVALYRTPYDFRLGDEGVTLFLPYGLGVDDAWIVRAAHAAARTAELLDAARARIRSAAPLVAHAEVLRALAGRRGLVFAGTPLLLAGRVDGRFIALGSLRTGRGHHHLHAHAPFEAAFGLGLVVRRERLVDGLRTLLGGQDVLVSDEAFDHRFLVQADPAHAPRLPALLDAGVRAALLELDARAGPVGVDDAGVSVDPIAATVAPPTVAWALDTLDEARALIEHNFLHGGEGGPYR
jgi:hypothetical protein